MLDYKRIYQVIVNLLTNAIKFTPENGKITIEAHFDEEKSEQIIRVSDTGIGIPKEDLSRIFERLYQVKTDDNYDCKGLGLGLAICKNIIDLHEGTIDVKSTVGEGTTFTVTIPTKQVDK